MGFGSLPTLTPPSLPASPFSFGIPSLSSETSSASDVSFPLPHKTTAIKSKQWNQLYNYVFSIQLADASGNVNGTGDPSSLLSGSNQAKTKFQTIETPYITLAIPPSSIGINVPFANTVTATNRGILEESSGSVFRNIQISGTTGLFPPRLVLGQKFTKPSTFTSVLNALIPSVSNTLNSLSKTANGLASSVNSFLVGGNNDNTSKPANLSDPNNSDADLQTEEDALEHTGYYQFWTLHNFFVQYAEAKKAKGAGSLRLVFSSTKDNISYICTPIAFDLKRDASNPLLYRYSISLKCWDIVNAAPIKTADLTSIPTKDDPLSIASALNILRQSRNLVNQARIGIQGVQSDFNNIMQIYTQGVLLLCDIVGVGHDLIDFVPILASNLNSVLNATSLQWNSALNSTVQDWHELLGIPTTSQLAQPSGSNQTASTSSSATGSGATPEAQQQQTAQGAASLNLAQQILNNATITSNLKLDQLGTLPASVQKQVNQLLNTASKTTSNQIQDLTNNLLDLANNLAYHAGMMDLQFAETYGLSTNIKSGMPSEDDILLAVAIIEARQAFLSTLASGDIYQTTDVNPFNDANQVLPSDAQVTTPNSAFPIFVNAGETLQKIAQIYLGDANRADEIVLLNNLKSPYIDEDGFTRSISQASGRTFLVNDSSSLEISQTITIQGTGVGSTRRTILNIQNLGGGNYQITVDGNPTLSVYSQGTNAFLTARLPGTVGSGDTLLIPSEDAANPQGTTRPTALLKSMDYVQQTFLIDMALDTTGDLIVDASGDVALAYGYQNAVQAMRLLVETEQGDLEQHPTYGLAAPIGTRNPTGILNQLNSLIQSSITNDPRFQNAVVSSSLYGTAILIEIIAQGVNGTGNIPVKFTVSL